MRKRPPRVLVVGDVMIDEWIDCSSSRLSPEAPVPVAVPIAKTHSPGGAANVVSNVLGLGLDATLVGVIGAEAAILPFGDEVIVEPGRKTTRKTRYVVNGHHVLRVDDEDTRVVRPDTTLCLIQKVRELVPQHDVVVISDYLKGVITDVLVEAILESGRTIPVVIDTKRADVSVFRGATLWTPNSIEYDSYLRHNPGRRGHEEFEYVLVTRGNAGMDISGRAIDFRRWPAVPVGSVADVTGAGDAVVASVAVYLATWSDWRSSIDTMIRLALCAGAVAVSHSGTRAVTRAEVARMLERCPLV